MPLSLHAITNRDEWNTTLRDMPFAHILQIWEWGEFKRATTGWQPERLAFKQDNEIVAMASIGIRRVGPLKFMVISKGPALRYEDSELLNSVLDILEIKARQERVVWLKIDPDVIAAFGIPNEESDTPYLPGQAVIHTLQNRSWTYSDDQVQFPNTITLDLTQDTETLLMNMSQNTRRKIRTAEKKNVTIRAGTIDDLETLYRLYQITGLRDEFMIRPFDYYKQAWQQFIAADLAHPLIAEFEGKPIAHVILFHFGEKCWYFYGASSNEERNRMPNYALQWAAIQWAKTQGYRTYDMWGAPTEFIETDPLWGVYGFKRGFRGTVTRYIGAWDYSPSKVVYQAYTQLRPRVLNLVRKRRA